MKLRTKTLTTSATTDIPADDEQVWALVSAIPRYAEWVDATAEVTSGPQVAVPGAVYTERGKLGPFRPRSTWRVEELDRARGTQAHVSRSSGPLARMAVLIAVTPLDTGTRLTLTLEVDVAAGPFSGPLGGLLQRVLEPSNRRSVAAFHELAVAELATAA